MPAPPRRIDVHHHVLPAFYVEALEARGQARSGGEPLPEWSLDRASEAFEAGGIEAAVLSVSSPGVHFGDDAAARALARRCNEFVAGLRRDHPARFGGLGVLPLPDVDGALAEIEYGLDTLGLDGVVLLSNAGGRYLGDPAFDEVMAELDRRGAVAFVHPTVHPTSDDLGLPWPTFLVEFPVDTTRAVLNLLLSGTLDRTPDVRYVLAHAGGAVPFLAQRLSMAEARPDLAERLSRPVQETLGRLTYDTALSASPEAVPPTVALAGADRVVFGTDFPYAPPEAVAEQARGVAESDALDDAARAAVERGNALRLFPRLAEALGA